MLHPNRVLAALQDAVGSDAVVITDGATFLCASRSMRARLDPGPFGCIGTVCPTHRRELASGSMVLVATGDGAVGFNAIRSISPRHKAPVLIVVANNGAWQIEVHDQKVTHGKVAGTQPQSCDHAAMARSFACMQSVETEAQLKPAICVHWLTGRRCSTWL